ncbi:PREDICTED: uncharacterized protein LOC103343231 isoform X4 [Prunus mume]|uniref:Uncharacterized protein LOC103337088 isoform X2 n=1 Tax=Prunus mume TaxID=102107 RepID=A0ABM1LVK6_PRUMU|nr:PREDICTED: uncharacterized protein LOC103337088 isoform X2 [Prunus mume]XP_016652476.1 PREDICTED: uncharacterized protein LOC103343231 isoform X4 [Prunus mume]
MLIGIKLCEGRTCPWPTVGKSIYCNIERLATGSPPTYLIGAALIREEWKSTLSVILDPREGKRNPITEAREYYMDADDIEGTLWQLPRHLVAERARLQCLKKCHENYLQTLKAIPRTLRIM